MDFMTLVKAALDLGIVHVLALFLVFAMHLQNKRLLNMLEKQEQSHLETLKTLTLELAKVSHQSHRK